jgi:outer membrane protein assembly factor BamB
LRQEGTRHDIVDPYYRIEELNPNTLEVIHTIPLPNEAYGGAIAYDGHNIWYMDGFTGSWLYRLDPDTGLVRQTYPVPSTNRQGDDQVGLVVSLPSRRLLDQRAGLIYILHDRGVVQVFDPEANATVRYLPNHAIVGDLVFLGTHLLGSSITIADGIQPGELVEINPETGEVSGFSPTIETGDIGNVGVPDGNNTGLAVVDGRFYTVAKTNLGHAYKTDGTLLATFHYPGHFDILDLAGGAQDDDQDGIANENDHAPNSALPQFVDVGSGFTSVRNGVDRFGVSIQDKVIEAQRLSLGDDKDYVRRIQALADALRSEGIITDAQVKELVKGARRSGKVAPG